MLADAGLEVEDPPEDWLTKVVSGNSFVDVLWRTCGHPVESDLIDRAEMLPVLSVQMPVLTATDIVVTKLRRSTSTTATSAGCCRSPGAARAGRLGRGGAPGSRTTTSPSSSVLLERLGIVEEARAA